MNLKGYGSIKEYVLENWICFLIWVVFSSIIFCYWDYLRSDEYQEFTKKVPRTCKVTDGYIDVNGNNRLIIEIDGWLYESKCNGFEYNNSLRNKGTVYTKEYSKEDLQEMSTDSMTKKGKFILWICCGAIGIVFLMGFIGGLLIEDLEWLQISLAFAGINWIMVLILSLVY